MAKPYIRDVNYHEQTIFELKEYFMRRGNQNIIAPISEAFYQQLHSWCTEYPVNIKDDQSKLSDSDILSFFVIHLMSMIPEGALEENMIRFRCLCNISMMDMASGLGLSRKSYHKIESGSGVLRSSSLHDAAEVIGKKFTEPVNYDFKKK